MLETEAQLGPREELDGLFTRWEVWAAGVLHSHGAFPILAYFRSTDHDNDWLSAFGAVLDAAALVRALVEDRPKDAKLRGQAFLLHRAGSRTARDLCTLFHLRAPDPIPADLEHLQQAHRRLQLAG